MEGLWFIVPALAMFAIVVVACFIGFGLIIHAILTGKP